MSLGSWDPDADAAAQEASIDRAVLARFINYSREGELENLGAHLEGDECQRLAGMMKIDHADWVAACESMEGGDLKDLIRFFAVAENLPGWEAGELSPVIPLAKILRRRGERLEKDFLLWLREVSENRFLPYGPL